MKIDEIVFCLAREIAQAVNPVKIYLVGAKHNIKGELTGFKLCVIVNDVPSTAELEGELYMKTDCDIPFDVLIYNLSEWNELIADEGTFASKIHRTGALIYGEG